MNMCVTRRDFILGTTCVAADLTLANTINPLSALAETAPPILAHHATGMRMAATPAARYRAYRSKAVQSPDVRTWVQIDLGSSIPIDAIQLFPASERMYPG